MRAFIELCAKGNRRVVIDTAAIVGVITAPTKQKGDLATAEHPVTLILRNAEPVEIIGIEPVMILAQMCVVAEKVDDLKQGGSAPPIVVQWLDRGEDD